MSPRLLSATPGPRRVLALLPEAFRSYGGIQAYNRLVISALAAAERAGALQVRTLILNDRKADLDPAYAVGLREHPRAYAGWRIPFSVASARAALSLRPDTVIFGHRNLLRLASLVRVLAPRSEILLIAYGVEVWPPESANLQRLACHVDRFVAISTFTASAVATAMGIDSAQVALLPCALDPAWAEGRMAPEAIPLSHRDPPILLSVARLAASERYKGIDTVIAAMPGVLKQVPQARYVVVGDGLDRARLERLARTHGVANHIDFRGHVSPDDLAKAYASARVFVLPSCKEGFGIVYLEAARYGVPCIGARFGGTVDVIEHGATGELVEYGAIAELETAIVALLRDSGRAARYSAAAARRLATHFDVRHFQDRLCRIITGPPAVGVGTTVN